MKEAPIGSRRTVLFILVAVLGIGFTAMGIRVLFQTPSAVDHSPPASTSAAPVADIDPAAVVPVKTGPVGLAAADSSVRQIVRKGSTVTVTADLGDAFDDEGMINNAAVTAYDVARQVKAGAPQSKGATTLKIDYTTVVQDRLGHQSTGIVLELSFSAADLRDADYANLNAMRIMNLATDKRVFAPSMAGVAAWCRHNGTNAPDFCNF